MEASREGLSKELMKRNLDFTPHHHPASQGTTETNSKCQRRRGRKERRAEQHDTQRLRGAAGQEDPSGRTRAAPHAHFGLHCLRKPGDNGDGRRERQDPPSVLPSASREDGMEIWLAGGFLPLLLLAWLSTGLTHEISATINVSVALDLVLQCLLQMGSSSTAGELKCFNTTQNNGEEQNEGGVELQKVSSQLIFTNVNKTYTGTCILENTGNVSKNKPFEYNKPGKIYKHHGSRDKGLRKGEEGGSASQPEESDTTMECKFKIWLENFMVHVKWYKPAGLDTENQTNITAPGENCTNLTSHGIHEVSTGICGCTVLITGINLIDTGNSSQGTVPSCGPPQTMKESCTGLTLLLCIVFGLAVATFLYMPIIGLLVWQGRRNRRGELPSRQVAEGNQLSMAAPVTGTEDLTYANLKFEKESKPTSSDIVYTEIKPSQQKQSVGDAGAANAGVDLSSEGEGK
ncbi:uncharacterized protein LOC116961539 isoform X2 [Tyto alba]|uniref:uncharacterized protein LOC116961539 isoform X2 n=1 Tax=Tyto alba TaxID=56313 RepID=UPI001C6748B0|nr:uncharacterized protein LOC116961539 isoform X2 [Tyto alba]